MGYSLCYGHTGPGKTYHSLSGIIYRIVEKWFKKGILFLADRNALIDPTVKGDFRPFLKVKKPVYSVKKGELVKF